MEPVRRPRAAWLRHFRNALQAYDEAVAEALHCWQLRPSLEAKQLPAALSSPPFARPRGSTRAAGQARRLARHLRAVGAGGDAALVGFLEVAAAGGQWEALAAAFQTQTGVRVEDAMVAVLTQMEMREVETRLKRCGVDLYAAPRGVGARPPQPQPFSSLACFQSIPDGAPKEAPAGAVSPASLRSWDHRRAPKRPVFAAPAELRGAADHAADDALPAVPFPREDTDDTTATSRRLNNTATPSMLRAAARVGGGSTGSPASTRPYTASVASPDAVSSGSPPVLRSPRVSSLAQRRAAMPGMATQTTQTSPRERPRTSPPPPLRAQPLPLPSSLGGEVTPRAVRLPPRGGRAVWGLDDGEAHAPPPSAPASSPPRSGVEQRGPTMPYHYSPPRSMAGCIHTYTAHRSPPRSMAGCIYTAHRSPHRSMAGCIYTAHRSPHRPSAPASSPPRSMAGCIHTAHRSPHRPVARGQPSDAVWSARAAHEQRERQHGRGVPLPPAAAAYCGDCGHRLSESTYCGRTGARHVAAA